MKAHLQVEGFPSNFAHVIVSRSQFPTTELPHNGTARYPQVKWLEREIERSRKHVQIVTIAFL